MNSIYDVIKKRREELGMSYQELSNKTGFSKSVLQRYETGTTKKIPADRIEKIAKALNVDPFSLYDFDQIYDDSKKTFAKNLNHYMNINNKTQDDIVKELGINKSTISTWCRGLKMPRIESIKKLATYFKISTSLLMGWQPNELEDEEGEGVETMTNEEKKELLNALKVVRNECKKHMDEKCNNCCLCTDEGCKLKIDAPRDWCLSNEKKDIWRAFN